MAFWVVAGGAGGSPLHDLDAAGPGRGCDAGDEGYFNLQDRATSCHGHHGVDGHAQYDGECEGRMEQQQRRRHLHQPHHHRRRLHHLETESVPIRNLAFLVIREGNDQDQDHNHNDPYSRSRNHTHGYRYPSSPSPSPSPKPYLPGESCAAHSPHTTTNLAIPTALERTESGHSISSDSSAHHHHPPFPPDLSLLEDLQAARLVRHHIALYRRRYPDSQPERILRALISPKSRGADFPLDNDALQSIFSAANELFFASRLTRRVTWDWSHSASAKYDNHILGTTAVRKSPHFDGLETLIVLSSPILRDTKYNRRLIISTFLHEMMHSFMFVTCGWNAKQSSGHTKGFLQIAGIIDDWAGKDCLHLRDMEANLERWRGHDYPSSCGADAASSTGASSAGDSGHHDGYSHGAIEPPSELSKYNYPLYLEQANESWDKRYASNGHDAHLLHRPLPQRHAWQEEWQWYEREDVGERLQYVAQTQYGSS